MSPGVLPSKVGGGGREGHLVFQLVCCFHRYWAYSASPQSGSRWSPAFKMEPVLSVSSFNRKPILPQKIFEVFHV